MDGAGAEAEGADVKAERKQGSRGPSRGRPAGVSLEACEEQYRSIVENSPVGVFFVDENYRPIYVNDEACRISGYSRDEVMGRDFRVFLAEGSKHVVAELYV
ncbi:MAG: PAS domain S-box protein, partial [Chloroflexi bacterium]|nr:PAS domain S-box protein [Chloroflexota bacterium]